MVVDARLTTGNVRRPHARRGGEGCLKDTLSLGSASEEVDRMDLEAEDEAFFGAGRSAYRRAYGIRTIPETLVQHRVKDGPASATLAR